MEENTTAYAEIVQKFRETRSPALFGNERPEHAAIIFREFFSNAEKRIVMLCRNMSSAVFGRYDVQLAMEVALRKRVPIDIVVQDTIETLDLKEKLNAWKAEGLPVKYIEAEGALDDEKANIAVMDGIAFRLEPNNSKTKAFACMYDPKYARILENQVYEYLSELA
jgi:hypothetical protein